MSRPSKWIAALAFSALLGFGAPSISYADDPPAAGSSAALSAQQQAEVAKAAELMGQGVSRDDPRVQQHLETAAALGGMADDAARRESMASQMERVRLQMETEKARAEAAKPPSMWEQAGNQILQGLIAALLDVGKAKLNDYINGGGQDDALLEEIRNLEEERARLEEELAGGPGTGGTGSDNGGLGEVITDPNGNTGYDTDGNGYVDIPLYPNGSPDDVGTGTGSDPITSTPGGVLPTPLGSDPSSLDDDDLDSPNPISVGGGGAGFGGLGGPNFGGNGGNVPGVGGVAGVNGANGEGEDGEEGEGGDALPGVGGMEAPGAGLPGAEGGVAGTPGSSDGSTTEDGLATEKKMGRVIVLPKLEFEDLAGNRKAKDDWSEEWQDDSWDDSADNGDFDEDWADDDDWGGEWDTAAEKGAKKAGGEETTTADDQKAAELVDQIIRVETAVAEWRKLEIKAKEAGVDPYGFQDEEMGYRASGTQERDPFKDVRTKDGKIDLTKVDVWLIEGESWKDGEQPVRYRLTIDPMEVTDFEPIHGGVAMIQGVLKEVEVDKRVLDEIKGKVKEIEVVRVLLSAEKPPEEGVEALEGGEAPTAEDGLGAPSEEKAPAPAPADDGWDDEGW